MYNLQNSTDFLLSCITHVGAARILPGARFAEEMRAALSLQARGLASVTFERGIERKNKTALLWSVSKPENTKTTAIAAYFNQNPDITLVSTEFGHGYTTAQHTGWCKLTQTRIERGDSIRNVSITTRSGRSISLFMATKTYHVVFTMGGVKVNHNADDSGNTSTELLTSRWSRYTMERATEAVDAGHRVEVYTKYGELRTYKLWSNGKWNGRQTSRALLGTLRRSKNAAMIRVTAD